MFLTIMVWIFKTYFQIAPVKTTLYLFTSILRESRTLVYAIIVGKIFDQLIILVQSPNVTITSLFPYMGILLLYEIFYTGFTQNVYNYSRRTIRFESRYKIQRIYYTHLYKLGIQSLENPDMINRFKRAEEWLYDTQYILEELFRLLSFIVSLIFAALLVFPIIPWVIPVIAIVAILRYLPQRKYQKADFHWQVDNTEQRRAIKMGLDTLTNPKELQEIQINNSFEYFDQKGKKFFDWYNKGLLSIIGKSELSSGVFNIIDAFISIIIYLQIFTKAIIGSISFGTIFVQIRSIDNVSNMIGGIMSSVMYLNEFAIKLGDLYFVLNAKPSVQDGKKRIKDLNVAPSIEFLNVSFKYPNSEKFVFKNLNLQIKAGERVAIVGHNGAGKTTLVKLISRIYSVTSGEILVNGTNLNDVKINDWYELMSVLFQEYNFYPQLSVKENIHLGRPNQKIRMGKIVEAAKSADADEFIEEYPKKYDQVLSEQFEGGIRPSTGQKQKIAIAKFFYRNAPLAIFDEPTAAIDAVSEYKIFNKIYDFFTNKTVIIISHRFSTVRNADKIFVMDHGKIVESGSHEELMKSNGVYANAFKLQAEGYRR